MNKISFPHDRFFKTAMTQNAVAKSFFAEHLPAFVRDLIDLNTLHLEKESFVTPKLQLFMSDMLFSADFSGNPGYLYLLVEHKSKPARTLPLTLLQYILLILEDHIKKQKKDKKKNRNKKNYFLPLVYPIILYNGKKTYPYSTAVCDLFNHPAELVQKMLFHPFQLIDLGAIPDEELKAEAWTSIMYIVMKHIYDRDVLPFIKGLAKDFQEVYESNGENYIEAVFNYLFSVSKVSNPSMFISKIEESLPPLLRERNMAMTIAEYYESRGIKKGIKQGMGQGIEKGIEKGAIGKAKTIAMKLLQEKIPTREIARITDLPVKIIDHLMHEEKTEK